MIYLWFIMKKEQILLLLNMRKLKNLEINTSETIRKINKL